MSKRSRKVEEEAKLDPDYRPTSELQEEGDKPKFDIPWAALIIVGSLLVIAIVCIIVIFAMGGPINK